ncbi:MAG TPA: ATP-binding protein [Rectinemataceae bacterium]|nr:ATP-binding protein [Rectinemataceae bacterium]
MKLRSRLAIYFFLVIAVVAGTTFFFVRRSTERNFRSFIFAGDSGKARVYATILGEYYSEHKDWIDLQSFLSEMPQLAFFGLDQRIHGERGGTPLLPYPSETISALLSDRIAVADINGIIVADTSGELLRTVHPPKHLAHGVPIMVNSERKGTVLVGSMVDSSLTGMSERFLGSISEALIWAVALSAGLTLVLGMILSAQVTRPVTMLTRAARSVAAGNLSTVVETTGKKGANDEIAELAQSFNAMTEELKRLEEAKKQIIADSAHELRTPLTLIQGSIEAMIDGVYPLAIPTLESVHEETVRLSHLIDMLRELDIIQSGRLSLNLESIDGMELLRRTAKLFTASAKVKNIILTVEEPSVAPSINADYLRIGEVVYNLVSNAIKYTPSEGKVRLRAEEDRTLGLVRFYVDDSGPGIPADERERIFERFYRIDKSRAADRGGRGLGLAIANEIAKAHGGGIAVGDSDLGGASFVLTLKSA